MNRSERNKIITAATELEDGLCVDLLKLVIGKLEGGLDKPQPSIEVDKKKSPCHPWPIGTTVRVRKDLEVEKRYGVYFFIGEMEQYKGRIFKIREYTDNLRAYFLHDAKCVYTPEMLEFVSLPNDNQ